MSRQYTMSTFWETILTVTKEANKYDSTCERYGQAWMNALGTIAPEMHQTIVYGVTCGDDVDPFFIEDKKEAVKFIHEITINYLRERFVE